MTSSPPPPPTGVLCRVDGESLNTLIEKYDQSLSTNVSEQERVEKLRQEYLTLKSKLTTLPQKIEYDALVPLGRRALCPGKIIHTNEILCLLGDNWFVECSTAKAIEIANHRISKLDEQHEGLRKERDLINNWKQEAERQLVETIGEGTVEIREDYDEDYEKHWQEQHRQSVRRHHQQLAKQRLEAKQEKNHIVGDEELWTRLEELEIQEELEDYLERENVSAEQVANISQTFTQDNNSLTPPRVTVTEVKEVDHISSSNNVPASENLTCEEKTEVIPSHPAPRRGKRVKFSADTIVHDISNDISYENHESYNNQEKSATGVTSFTEESTMSTYPCFDPIMIRFRHSSPADLNDEDANASGTEEEDHTSQIVASPGEIVKVFGPTSISAISNKPLPKSILKPFARPLVTEKMSKPVQEKASIKKKPALSFADGDNVENDDDIDLDSITAVSKVVTERVPVFTSLQINESSAPGQDSEPQGSEAKPVSLFKMRRQQQQQAAAMAVTTSPD